MTEYTRVIRPVEFTPAQLVSTNAVNPDATWVAGSYASGARVTHTISDGGVLLPHQFESLIGSNSGTPGVDADKWLDLGPANTVAMFSRLNVSRKTSRSGVLQVVLKPGAYVTSIGLFGLRGEELVLEVVEPDGVTVVSTDTRSIVGRQVASMLEYLFEPRTQIERALFEGLAIFPGPAGRSIRITITGAEAAIGAVCYGSMAVLGASPKNGATWELMDFLGIERDDFGNLIGLLPEAPYADTVSFSATVQKERIAAFKAVVVSLRQVVTVWVGNGGSRAYDSVLVVLGVRSGALNLIVSDDVETTFDIQITGVTAD